MALTKAHNRMIEGAAVNVKDFGAVGDGVTDDTAAIQAAFDSISGAENTGYGADVAYIDLSGDTYLFSGNLYVPTNVSLSNGTLKSALATERLIWRNPYIANTGLRAYTEYWAYMTSKNSSVTFECPVIINCYIGLAFDQCKFNGVVLVNSDNLWTEFTAFTNCFFADISQTGGCIRFDGNKSGASTFSTGTGAGASDGSFGYTSFVACRIDSTAPQVGIGVVDGGLLYNAKLEFRGYTRNAAGAFLYLDSSVNKSKVHHSSFKVHLESFGAASNVISTTNDSEFWYNNGSINSASPEMIMTQSASSDLRRNDIDVWGVVLLDEAGSTVFGGTAYNTKIYTHLSKRRFEKPKFSAYRTANINFTHNTQSKVPLDTETFDIGGYFDSATNYRFQPKTAGYYQISASVSASLTGVPSGFYCSIYKNGSMYAVGSRHSPVTGNNASSVSSLVYLNGDTDYVELYVFAFDNLATPQITGGSEKTFLTGCLVDY